MADQPLLTIIAPVHNEQGNIPELYRRLSAVLDPITDKYELLFVDDGSTDGSAGEIQSLRSVDGRVSLVEFSRNFGKEMAMLAGYDHARGQAAIVIDADLQTPPEVIPEMVAKWRAGAEIVDAIRTATVGQGRLRRLCSQTFYWLMRKLTKTNIIPDSVDFRLMDEKAIRQVRACRERFRFNRGLVGWIGFRRETVTFVAAQRHAGQTGWPILRLVSYAMDAIFSFSALPLRLAGLVGLAVSLLSFLYMLWLVFDNVVRHDRPIPGYATLACGIFFLGGAQLLGIWLLGEYVGRMYEEVKARPPYVTRRVLLGGEKG